MSKIGTDDFLQWDLSTLSHALRNKQLSPVEVTRKMLDQILSSNAELNSYITISVEEALAEASQAEKEINAGKIRGHLHGVPIAIKDIIFTKDVKTTMGSEIYCDYIPEYDATVVKKLKEAGAVILGKLNTHQFAYGATGDRSYFGPVKNPHNLQKMPGGSSSGSGAAVAASLSYAALGTDTGGSVRIPSSFVGIIGMKPTFGRVSKYGAFPLCETMDHIGPMTKTVHDNALLLSVMSGYDESDPYSASRETEDFTRYLNKGIEGSVIGVPSSNQSNYVNDEVNKSVQQAIETFRSLGAEIRSVEIPNMEKILAAFRTTLKSEAYATHEQRLGDYPDKWDKEVKDRILTGLPVETPEYIQAQQIKQESIREYNKLLSEVDILVTPTVPILPANIEQREIDINGSSVHISLLLNHFTGPLNLNGFPALSIPCGVSKSGLPIGLQLIGKPFDEANIYRFAYAFENRK